MSGSSNRLKKTIDSLHDEMEIAEYAKVGLGNKKRRTPRKQMAERTKKRKRLERQDIAAAGVAEEDVEEEPKTRLRGSRVAMQEGVIQDSLLFKGDEEYGTDEDGDDAGESSDDESDGLDNDEAEDESSSEDEDEGKEAVEDEEGDIEEGDEYDVIDEEEEEEEEDEDVKPLAKAKKPKKVKFSKATKKKEKTVRAKKSVLRDDDGNPIKAAKLHRRKKRKRPMYRMKNFKSQRMVERHGDAIGAHLQGNSHLAIRRLEQLAADAPAAPQVYSSLGMVYEEMLNRDDHTDWKENLEVAKKAYGSYHVNSLLCKKDYMAWVRAADTARDVSDLYSIAMREEGPHEHRKNKLHWVQEALKDYQSADNLKPPGLDIPAKLAASHMELGNLSEALTILTDLKKHPRQTHKTWMLYADLMLRIGHECTQWNKGDEMNPNYMFRRWLRKYSRIFDWQERRLQALSLALESAAGSASCRKIINWTMQRAKEKSKPIALLVDDAAIYDNSRWHVDSYESQQNNEDALDDEAETMVEDGIPRRLLTRTLNLDDARAELLAKNKSELDVFDEETETLGDSEADDRADAREELVKSHRREIMDLVGARLQEKKAVTVDPSRSSDLPVAASCTTVCGIASELIKHCLGLEQFEGGRLVAESVSLYLKERSAMREKRVHANLEFERKQRSTASDVLLNRETYDESDEESMSDDDTVHEYLSDEEILLSNDGLAAHFKKGILPPELQVLYALCLVAAGGKDYLASKCMEAIKDLRDDTGDGIEQKLLDTDAICYPSWQVYRQAMTDQLTRIPAFSFVADVLQKTNTEKEWSIKLVALFCQEMVDMRASGIIAQALAAGTSKNPKIVLRKTQVFKIVLASARLNVLALDSRLDAMGSHLTAAQEALACYDELYPDFLQLWNVEHFGTPSKSSVEALQIMVRAYRLLEKAGVDATVRFQKIQELLPLFVGMPNKVDVQVQTLDESSTFSSFPLPSSWQDEELRLLSTRAHNLCVASSVTNFSGWESEEFNLDLLQRKGRSNYFGISLNDGRVLGHISVELAKGLSEIWSTASSAVGVEIDFAGSLEKASTFLMEDCHVEPLPNNDDVATYGENHTLFVLVDYARLCFEKALTTDATAGERTKSTQLGLSLLLPITQFCVLDRVWDSRIGQATASLSGVGEWRSIAGSGPSTGPKAMRPLRKKQLRSVGQWHETDLSLLARIVVIPVQFMLAEWKGEDSDGSETILAAEDKAVLQQRLHDAMCHLRACSTAHALQKASLQVTLALVELVPHAYNPFLVMQQAAMFASQCAKGGNLDVSFRTELPTELDCTPTRALAILVRADCLQALHFAQEATYLCSFVARACQMHRDRLQNSDAARWTCRWKVIGMCTHTISMAIRSTICAIHPTKEAQTKALEAWADDTLGELERCRADAKVMRRAIMGDEYEEEEEELEEDGEGYEVLDNGEEDGDAIIDIGHGDVVLTSDSAEDNANSEVFAV